MFQVTRRTASVSFFGDGGGPPDRIAERLSRPSQTNRRAIRTGQTSRRSTSIRSLRPGPQTRTRRTARNADMGPRFPNGWSRNVSIPRIGSKTTAHRRRRIGRGGEVPSCGSEVGFARRFHQANRITGAPRNSNEEPPREGWPRTGGRRLTRRLHWVTRNPAAPRGSDIREHTTACPCPPRLRCHSSRCSIAPAGRRGRRC